MKVSFLFIVSFFTFSSFSQTCLEGDCINGIGTLKNKDKSVYVGEFKDSLFHGKGTLTYSNNNIYTGKFK